jgi:glutathione S-transferase
VRDALILYVEGYFTNVWDATCFIALHEKGLEFDIVRALLREGQGVPAGLREHAAIGRIPALQHGQFWLTESFAIVEYLEEAFPEPDHAPLFPADPVARGRARQVMSWLRADTKQLRDERPWQTMVYPASLPPLGAIAARQAAELIELVDWLARAGALETWNIAHADLALALMRLTSSAYALSPAAQALLDANLARPSVRAYLEMQRPPHPPPQARS